MQSATKPYFPTLDTLRCVAASAVFLSHMEQWKMIFGLPNAWDNSFVNDAGIYGVIFFFVLSGFLISFLLLQERNYSQKVKIGAFYLRRIRRIWPLYFLIVSIGLWLVPNLSLFDIPLKPPYTETAETHFFTKALLFYLILPNVVLVAFPPVQFVAQTWSIGIEEQFYLIWPHLFNHKRQMKWIIIFAILLFTIIPFLAHFLIPLTTVESALYIILATLKSLTIGCMGIGALFAFLYVQKSKIINFFTSPISLCLTLITLVALFYSNFRFSIFNSEIYSLLFGIVILNSISNPIFIKLLRNEFTEFLGRISYGLYMYHPITIVVSIKIINQISQNFSFNVGFQILLYAIAVTLTISVSYASYRLFELPIMRLRTSHTDPQ